MSPHILVTNDDGITAPGIVALAAALRALGEVSVVAPDRNWSISGHQKALERFLRADPVPFPVEGVRAWAADGAPADCVALATMGLLERVPDLVVSGINRGPNLGQDITYSGTVAATFEAAIFGLPAIAVSLNDRRDGTPYEDAAAVAVTVARHVLREGLPRHTLLNVNVPATPAATWVSTAVTRVGRRVYQDELVQGVDPAGRPFYWIASREPQGDVEAMDTDIWAIHHNRVSVTPIRLDMTDKGLLAVVRGWRL